MKKPYQKKWLSVSTSSPPLRASHDKRLPLLSTNHSSLSTGHQPSLPTSFIPHWRAPARLPHFPVCEMYTLDWTVPWHNALQCACARPVPGRLPKRLIWAILHQNPSFKLASRPLQLPIYLWPSVFLENSITRRWVGIPIDRPYSSFVSIIFQ